MQVTADVLDLSGDTNLEPLSPFNLEPLALSDPFSEGLATRKAPLRTGTCMTLKWFNILPAGPIST